MAGGMVSDGIKAARIQARYSPLIGLTWEPVSFPASIGSAIKNATTRLNPPRLAFLCWRTRAENPVFTAGFLEAAVALGLREPPGPSAAFSLADTGAVGALLSGTGSAASSSRRPTSRCSSAPM
jgi:hypothetical protein